MWITIIIAVIVISLIIRKALEPILFLYSKPVSRLSEIIGLSDKMADPKIYFKRKKVQKFCSALIQNDFETTDELLKKGLDINIIGTKVKKERKNEYAPTILVWLFLGNEDSPEKLKAFKYLLGEGADPMIQFRNYGATMLHEAASYKYPDYLRMILEAGSVEKDNLNVALNIGTINSPLLKANAANRFENFRLLLDAGADMDWIEEKTGRSTLQYCSMDGDWKFAYELLIRGVDYKKDLEGIIQTIEMEGIGSTHSPKVAYNWRGEDDRQKVVQFFREKGIEIKPGMNPWEKYVSENEKDVLYINEKYFNETGEFLGKKKIKEMQIEHIKDKWVKFFDSYLYEGTTEDPDTQIYLEEKWEGKAENKEVQEEETAYQLQRAIVDVIR